ncbi:MAG: hypothetical protein HY238_19025 [Acidobacteria bacterium]|nr:hypothetical protein [Acidobacteriota bacterium]
MKLVRVKVDIGGTRRDDAWTGMRHFEEVEPREAVFRLFCGHNPDELHPEGEWGEATLKFEDFIAEYAVAFYLKQRGVIDADVEAESE